MRRERAILVVCLLLYASFLSGITLNSWANHEQVNRAVNGQHLAWCCGKVSNQNESWFLVLPPSEGGNISREGQLLDADRKDIGVIIDDFDLQNQTIQSRLLSVVPGRFGVNVCPVVSAAGLLNGVSGNKPNTGCVVIVVEPYAAFGPGEFRLVIGDLSNPVLIESQEPGLGNLTSVSEWTALLGRIVSDEGGGKSVFLLVYDRPYSGWFPPIPANYSIAVRHYAESHGLGLIDWS